ncbi:hypothetical protein [Sporosarcina thermotolerans]
MDGVIRDIVGDADGVVVIPRSMEDKVSGNREEVIAYLDECLS